MSLEQSIADLTTQAGQLLDLPQDIADEAIARLTAMSQAYDTLLTTQKATIYVDPVNGDDNAQGLIGSPVKTLNEGVSRCPRGGQVTLILTGDTEITTAVDCAQRHVIVTSNGATRHTITFGQDSYVSGGNTYREGIGFDVGEGSLVIKGLTLSMPRVGVYAGALIGSATPVIRSYSSSRYAARVVIVTCDIDRTADAWGALINANVLQLVVSAVVETDQAMLGWWLSGVTNGAGTDTTTLPGLVTNLANI